MASKQHTDPVYAEKRKPKGPIRFNVQLNDEQKEAKDIILNSTVTILKGKAGSGKTLLAANVALDQFFKGEVEKIIVTRPTVTAGAGIGFLPGDINSKLQPFTAPVYDNMHRLYDKAKIESLLLEGKIEVIPIDFLRGRNFSNSIVVVDEGQNITHTNMELILSRICFGTRMIICGDSAQIDLRDRKESGFEFLIKHFKDVEGMSVVSLLKNHRHPIVEDILKVYNDYRS